MEQAQKDKLLQQLIQKVISEFNQAVMNDSLEELIEKYDLVSENREMFIVNQRTQKILVIGALQIDRKDLEKVCRVYRIPIKRVDFLDDYSKLSGFSVETLRYSSVYSDVLIGAVPHKITDLGDSSSIITKIKQNPKDYPKLIVLSANRKFKITKNNFEKALKQTRLYESINSY